jgi:glycosyltransferase involved in cell wall biosynthesis
MSKADSVIKILHIASHLGGGVGKALSNIVTFEKENNSEHIHKILLIDHPEKKQFIDICCKCGVEVLLKNDNYNIIHEIESSDIVILHWWHHPIMAEFLRFFPEIPTRIVLWSHVNGCNYPCLPYDFVSLPHKTFFTSPFSYENSFWNDDQRLEVKEKAVVVYGLGQLEFYNTIQKNISDEFILGYVGTLNKSKIHPQFVDYCYAVLQKVPNARFIMVGDNSGSEEIIQKAKNYDIEDKFLFTGYSNQVVNELSKFDVFAYPLNPKHFGTTENVLLEAMAFGLPVVALNHNAEKYIILNDKEVGLLADSVEHYADCIKYLYDNPDERKRIGINAREYIETNFTFEKNVTLMRNELDQIISMPKKVFNFKNIFGNYPYEWFLSCLGEDKTLFRNSIDGSLVSNQIIKNKIEEKIRNCSPILKENTKSSIRHFSTTFPDDLILQYWSHLINVKS